MAGELASVSGFPLALDRGYHPDSHMWVLGVETGRVRIGLDALGVETSGTLAELSFHPVKSALTKGRPFGQLEAAKFVGPLVSPVSGTLLAVNAKAALDPGLVERDPYGEGWLIEAQLEDEAAALAGLLSDPEEITAWFSARVVHYRLQGVLAE
jgi:glycine cleavage system H protein